MQHQIIKINILRRRLLVVNHYVYDRYLLRANFCFQVSRTFIQQLRERAD